MTRRPVQGKTGVMITRATQNLGGGGTVWPGPQAQMALRFMGRGHLKGFTMLNISCNFAQKLNFPSIISVSAQKSLDNICKVKGFLRAYL